MLFRAQEPTGGLKRWHIFVLIAMLIATIGLRIYHARWPKARVNVGGQTIEVLAADTLARRTEGWSNKKSMGTYGGMLFVFPEKREYTMVMRDMHFSLDIVWVDEGKIVDIAPRAEPERGREEADLTQYTPRVPATFVIELPAGFTEQHGMKIGDPVIILD